MKMTCLGSLLIQLVKMFLLLCGLIEEGLSQEIFSLIKVITSFSLWPFWAGVGLLMNLEDFHFEHQITSMKISLHDLDPDAELFSFQCRSIPIILKWRFLKVSESTYSMEGQFSFVRGIFILNPKQISLLKEIKGFPQEEREKMPQLWNSDRDRLLPGLIFVWSAGHSFCPERLQTWPFHQSFYFDRGGWLHPFGYPVWLWRCWVTSGQQLEQLLFSSDAVLEDQLFPSLFRGWFWGWFSVLETGLWSQRLFILFHHRIPALRNWVKFPCLSEINQLYSVQAPQGSDWVQREVVWKSNLTSKGIAQEEIDPALPKPWPVIRISISVLRLSVLFD